jgi:chitinase
LINRWLSITGLLTTAWLCAAADLPPHVFVAYHDSWNEWPALMPQETSLAEMPEYIDLVLLAFAKPDLTYHGDLDITDSGLEYRMSGQVLRDAIGLLKASHRNTRVLLSVGGAAYGQWDSLATPAIAAFVRDFGLDGVDIDFEPADPDCNASSDGRIACATDKTWDRIIAQLRTFLPRPLLLTASVWSVGAFGEGRFLGSRPRTPYTGFMLPLMRSQRAADLDLLSIDAYDAGSQFNPTEAFAAYRSVWAGRLALGIEVQRTGGAGPFPSAEQAEALARTVVRDPQGGMMLYPLLATPDADSGHLPTGSDLARALCRGLGSAACDEGIH